MIFLLHIFRSLIYSSYLPFKDARGIIELVATHLQCRAISYHLDSIFQTSDFPISKELVIGLLEVIAPFKHFAYLRDFMKIMPAGFPIKLGLSSMYFLEST